MKDLKTAVLVVGRVRGHGGGFHETEVTSSTEVLGAFAENLGGRGRHAGATEGVKEEKALVDRAVAEISVYPVFERQCDGCVGRRGSTEDVSGKEEVHKGEENGTDVREELLHGKRKVRGQNVLVQGVDGGNGGKHNDGNRAENTKTNPNDHERSATCNDSIQHKRVRSVVGRLTALQSALLHVTNSNHTHRSVAIVRHMSHSSLSQALVTCILLLFEKRRRWYLGEIPEKDFGLGDLFSFFLPREVGDVLLSRPGSAHVRED